MGIQCPSSTQVSRKPSTRSPQYSDIADEQEMLLFGGLNASDSGFGGSSNVLHPDEAGNLQVMSLLQYVNIDFNYTQGWIQHDLVGGGGGGVVLCQLWCRVVSVMCAARPSTCFTTAKSSLTTVFEL